MQTWSIGAVCWAESARDPSFAPCERKDWIVDIKFCRRAGSQTKATMPYSLVRALERALSPTLVMKLGGLCGRCEEVESLEEEEEEEASEASREQRAITLARRAIRRKALGYER